MEAHKDAINHLKNLFTDKSENKFNILKLQNAIKDFKENYGKGMFSIELFRNDNGSIITGYNTNQFASHIYTDIYKNINKSIEELEEDSLLDYYIVDLNDNKAIIVGDIQSDEYNYISYGILVSFDKIAFAMFFNLILPRFIKLIKKSL